MCRTCLPGAHDPIFCIIPPHVFRRIAETGSAAQRKGALRTMALDDTARMLRATRQARRVHARGTPMTRAQAKPQRTVHDFRGNDAAPGTLPGKVVRSENDSAVADDPAVNEAFDHLGATFKFYWDVFRRNSIDDEGLHLDATVHYAEKEGESYDNALWNGHQMLFGDGDGVILDRLTIDLDIVGHELTHGVIGHEAKLVHVGQAGALNESIADVFGSLVKQYAEGQTADRADWLIGGRILLVKGRNGEDQALRSLKQPGTAYANDLMGEDSQPAHMKDYREIDGDYGGAHTNAGIPNHAFYLLAKSLGGHAWEKAGRIWYETLRDGKRVQPTASFADFAAATVINAGHLYGTNSTEQNAVVKAWEDVGVEMPVA